VPGRVFCDPSLNPKHHPQFSRSPCRPSEYDYPVSLALILLLARLRERRCVLGTVMRAWMFAFRLDGSTSRLFAHRSPLRSQLVRRLAPLQVVVGSPFVWFNLRDSISVAVCRSKGLDSLKTGDPFDRQAELISGLDVNTREVPAESFASARGYIVFLKLLSFPCARAAAPLQVSFDVRTIKGNCPLSVPNALREFHRYRPPPLFASPRRTGTVISPDFSFPVIPRPTEAALL